MIPLYDAVREFVENRKVSVFLDASYYNNNKLITGRIYFKLNLLNKAENYLKQYESEVLNVIKNLKEIQLEQIQQQTETSANPLDQKLINSYSNLASTYQILADIYQMKQASEAIEYLFKF